MLIEPDKDDEKKLRIILDDMKKYGIRNKKVISIAPKEAPFMFVKNETAGIEPPIYKDL